MKVVKCGFYLGQNCFEIAETDPAGNKTGTMIPKCCYYVLSYDEDTTDTSKNGLGKPALEKIVIDQKDMKINSGTKVFTRVNVIYKTRDVKDENGKPAMRLLASSIELV